MSTRQRDAYIQEMAYSIVCEVDYLYRENLIKEDYGSEKIDELLCKTGALAAKLEQVLSPDTEYKLPTT